MLLILGVEKRTKKWPATASASDRQRRRQRSPALEPRATWSDHHELKQNIPLGKKSATAASARARGAARVAWGSWSGSADADLEARGGLKCPG